MLHRKLFAVWRELNSVACGHDDATCVTIPRWETAIIVLSSLSSNCKQPITLIFLRKLILSLLYLLEEGVVSLCHCNIWCEGHQNCKTSLSDELRVAGPRFSSRHRQPFLLLPRPERQWTHSAVHWVPVFFLEMYQSERVDVSIHRRDVGMCRDLPPRLPYAVMLWCLGTGKNFTLIHDKIIVLLSAIFTEDVHGSICPLQ